MSGNSNTTQRQRVHEVGMWCRVTKGFYRNHKCWCPYKIDCDVVGSMFYLESLGTYFSEDYITFNVEDNLESVDE